LFERRWFEIAAEKNFENRVKKFLKDEGCWFVKYWGGGTFTKSGVPDLLVCADGQFIGLELKAPNGKASDLQKTCLKKIDEAGGMGILLYPKDFDRFKKLIWAINAMNIEEIYEIYTVLKGRWC
jgi:hypothetical protein